MLCGTRPCIRHLPGRIAAATVHSGGTLPNAAIPGWATPAPSRAGEALFADVLASNAGAGYVGGRSARTFAEATLFAACGVKRLSISGGPWSNDACYSLPWPQVACPTTRILGRNRSRS